MMKVFQDRKLYHGAINFYLPHDFGGANDPLEGGLNLNLYSEKEELPIIMPKTIPSMKSEQFYVELVQR